MSDDRRWGFEEAEDWEYEDTRPSQRTDSSAAELVSGQDPDRVVTVTVTPTADVVSVRLAADWRRSVDPRALHESVRAAANAATMQALALQLEQRPTAPQGAPATEPTAAPGTSDQTPITREDALRLMDAVSADLERFTRKLAATVDQPVTVESAGGHVRGSAQRGQVLELSIDPNWSSGARVTEIESELTDVLTKLRNRSVPPDLASGPQSPAIAELTALLNDPQALLRRVGLLP